MELLYHAAIPLLGIYPKKTIISKDTCTPVLTGALFTQPGCGSNLMSIHREMGKGDVVHSRMEYYLIIKNEGNWLIFRDLDGPRDHHTL